MFNDQGSGLFTTIDHTIDRHLYSVTYDPATGASPEDFPTERCTGLIRLIPALPDLEPRIKAVAPWEMAAMVADRFRVGRVLLAGDAAKVTPPSGGMGGNTAIGDAYDLAWKLDSTARPGLLDRYDGEGGAGALAADGIRHLALLEHEDLERPAPAGLAEEFQGFGRLPGGRVPPDASAREAVHMTDSSGACT
ncbi:FAD-dependent monooxygenase [Nonomuraea sp. NPDC047529]|uniref:FAD-dependent monooxygenase n=1 Tax=Nonomuraea sp. NPDC047529 TaxID=3155623 RepID=UPI00340A308D